MTPGLSRHHVGLLPAQATGFVGRTSELAQVSTLLTGARLVTVTGTGGVGKTRLALRAAAAAAGGYRDGIQLVELSPLRDPALLESTVASHLGLRCEDKRPRLATVLDYLRDRRMLLILDTCEHLIDACAAFTDAILRAAPEVTILATSRQPLAVPGECAIRLHPLAVPEADDPGPDSDAVMLFAQRAAAVVDGFTIAGNRGEVIGICRALDGIPLAIELAAVRLRALPVDQLAKRLDDRFRALTGGRRTGTPRHQTLRAAIEWSYELCTHPEQVLWARLSVFAGSFALAAAQEVCADSDLSRETIVKTLGGLVEKSVLVRDVAPDVTTYRMLDTLREFGAGHVADAEQARLRNRFVAHYLAMAQRFGQDPMREQLSQYRGLRREHANLLAAFDYALGLRGNDSAAISMATSLTLYWRLSGRLREGEYWLNRALRRCAQPSAARARLLGARAYVIMLLGDFAAARADAEETVELAAKFGDMPARGRGYVALQRTLIWTGRLAEASETTTAAARCLGSADDPFALASLDIQTAMLHLDSGEPGQVIERCAEGLSRLPADERWATGYLLGLQCAAHLQRGEFGPGGDAGRLGLLAEYELGDMAGTAYLLGTNAFLAAGQHRYERTAWLLGASAPLWERAGRWYTGAPAIVALHQGAERDARASLGDDHYWDLHARGGAAPLERVVKLALANTDNLWDATVGLGVTPSLRVSSKRVPDGIAEQH